jgi:hypothetical protein
MSKTTFRTVEDPFLGSAPRAARSTTYPVIREELFNRSFLRQGWSYREDQDVRTIGSRSSPRRIGADSNISFRSRALEESAAEGFPAFLRGQPSLRPSLVPDAEVFADRQDV